MLAGGIGRAIILKLAAEGANIVLNCVKGQTEAEKLKQDMEGFGVKALVVQADVGIFSQAQEW